MGLRSRRTKQCGLTTRTSTRSSSQAQWSTITVPTMFSRLWRRSDNDLMSLSLSLWSVPVRSHLHSACVNKLLATNLIYHGRFDIALVAFAGQITALTLFKSRGWCLSHPFLSLSPLSFPFPNSSLSLDPIHYLFSLFFLPVFSCCEVGYTEYVIGYLGPH